MIYNSKTCFGILNDDLDCKLKLEFSNRIWADRNLEHKILLEDNAQLWQYWLWSFKSGDTKLVVLESKLQFRILTLKLELELI